MSLNLTVDPRKLRETTMYRVAKFAPRIGIDDRIGIRMNKESCFKEGLGGRPQRTKMTKMMVYS